MLQQSDWKAIGKIVLPLRNKFCHFRKIVQLCNVCVNLNVKTYLFSANILMADSGVA